MTELPKALRARLAESLAPSLGVVSRQTADAGETVKWAFEAAGGARIETVLMAYPNRVTVCRLPSWATPRSERMTFTSTGRSVPIA